jgi:antitoxin Phd
MREWALQDAKARLSEVVRLAMGHEPQEITLAR